MKTNRTTARLFTRETRWISIVHTGSIGETSVKIGTISGDIFLITLPTDVFNKIYKNVQGPMTTEEGFTYLLINMDHVYISPELVERFKIIEETLTPEDVIYLMENDPAQVYPEFQSRI